MTPTSENIKSKTYTVNSNTQYGLAIAGTIHISNSSCILSEQVQSVSTNRTDGQIKLYVAPREILEHQSINSTK